MRISGASSLSYRSVSIPSDRCAENTAIAGKIKKSHKSSLISKEKVNKVWGKITGMNDCAFLSYGPRGAKKIEKCPLTRTGTKI